MHRIRLCSIKKNFSSNKSIAAIVYGKKMNEQAIVDGYATAITNAIAGLVVRNGYIEIEKALKTIPADLTVYTDASVNALKATLALIDYTKEPGAPEIQGYADAIVAGVKALVTKPAPQAPQLRTMEAAPRSLLTNKPDTTDLGRRW